MKTLNKKEQIYVAAGILNAVIIILCVLFVYQPMFKKIMNCSKEEKDILLKLKKASEYAEDKEKLTDEIKKIRKNIAFYEGRLPKETNIPKVLDELIEIGEKSQVTFVSIVPKEAEKMHAGDTGMRSYLKIPIELKLNAGYHSSLKRHTRA